MKNICFLVGNLNNAGGIERVTSVVANALATKGYNVFILNLIDGKNPFFELNPNIKIDCIFSKPVSFKTHYLTTIFEIRSFIVKYKINTLIVADSISCIFTVAALIGIKKVKHICWEHFNYDYNLGLKLRDLGRKLAAKYCDIIVTLTNEDKLLWEKSLTSLEAKIVTIANPTPFENIVNTPSLKHKTVLAVGRLTYQKGFDLLLEAWAKVYIRNPEWMLIIVGNGEDKHNLKTKLNKLNLIDSVKFIETTNKILDYYKNSSIFCLSSRFEGFGMVLLEAMSVGLPIVSFNCKCGPSDLIEHNGNGYLVDNGDISQLAEALDTMINASPEDYDKFIKKSYELSLKYYVDSLIKQWIEII